MVEESVWITSPLFAEIAVELTLLCVDVRDAVL